ncbi:MAG: hypothetical protein ACRDQ5_05245, partial [Sciscionella sp.]
VLGAADDSALGFRPSHRRPVRPLLDIPTLTEGTVTPTSFALSLDERDALLNPPGAAVRESLASRRVVIVDAALLSGAVVADQMVARRNAQPASTGGPEGWIAPQSLTGAAARVASVHHAYQAARYGDVAGLLPSVTDTVDALVAEGPATERRHALRLQCSTSIAAAKLATRVGDAATAWTAAGRARVAADAADDVFGRAASTYQLTCALLRAGHREDAERLAVAAADDIRGGDRQSLTWRGALNLLSAIIAARRNDPVEASRRLDHADGLARRLGTDGDIGWTAFGPTNVLIHRVSTARILDDPYTAIATAEQIDLTAIPVGLHGR